jgi:hypothetical protein
MLMIVQPIKHKSSLTAILCWFESAAGISSISDMYRNDPSDIDKITPRVIRIESEFALDDQVVAHPKSMPKGVIRAQNPRENRVWNLENWALKTGTPRANPSRSLCDNTAIARP